MKHGAKLRYLPKKCTNFNEKGSLFGFGQDSNATIMYREKRKECQQLCLSRIHDSIGHKINQVMMGFTQYVMCSIPNRAEMGNNDTFRADGRVGTLLCLAVNVAKKWDRLATSMTT